MSAPIYIDKQKLYELAELIVTGMVVIFGYQYIKQIIEYVLTELYELFIQKGFWPL